MGRSRRALLFSLLLAGVGWSVTARADHEAYELVQPRIEDLAATNHGSRLHKDLGKRWRSLHRVSLEFAAMALEIYPGADLFFKGRNTEPLYYATRLAAGKESPGQRIRVVNISHSGTLKHPNLSDYLRDKGLHDKALAEGRKLAFFDGTTYEGTTTNAVRRTLAPENRGKLAIHVLPSLDPSIPSARLAAHWVYDRREAKDYLEQGKTPEWSYAARWEFGYFPLYTHNSDSYAQLADGRWVAMSCADRRTRTDDPRVENVALARQEAVHFLEDLKAYLQKPSSQRRVAKRRALWRATRQVIDTGDVDGLIDLIQRVHRRGSRDRVARAFAADATELFVLRHPQLRQKLLGTRRPESRWARRRIAEQLGR
jgi:hypothetical protein